MRHDLQRRALGQIGAQIIEQNARALVIALRNEPEDDSIGPARGDRRRHQPEDTRVGYEGQETQAPVRTHPSRTKRPRTKIPSRADAGMCELG